MGKNSFIAMPQFVTLVWTNTAVCPAGFFAANLTDYITLKNNNSIPPSSNVTPIHRHSITAHTHPVASHSHVRQGGSTGPSSTHQSTYISGSSPYASSGHGHQATWGNSNDNTSGDSDYGTSVIDEVQSVSPWVNVLYCTKI